MKKDAKLYNGFHALIVELAKRNCRKKPVCKSCPLEGKCAKRI
jgi:endonuclease-3 related protein